MIDLSKLAAQELPSQDITLEIMGTPQTIKVTAPDDEIATEIFAIGTDQNKNDAEKTLAITRIILKNCVPGLSVADIELLIKKALTEAALPIVAKARDLRQEYDQAKATAIEQAKKKSLAENSAPESKY